MKLADRFFCLLFFGATKIDWQLEVVADFHHKLRFQLNICHGHVQNIFSAFREDRIFRGLRAGEIVLVFLHHRAARLLGNFLLHIVDARIDVLRLQRASPLVGERHIDGRRQSPEARIGPRLSEASTENIRRRIALLAEALGTSRETLVRVKR